VAGADIPGDAGSAGQAVQGAGPRDRVFPETKHPTYFRNLGLELETPLVQALRRNNLDRPGAKVFIQSFEAHNLAALHDKYRVRVPLVFLTSASGSPFNDRGRTLST